MVPSSSSSSLPIFSHDTKPNLNFPRHTATFHPSIWGNYFLSSDSIYEDDSDIKQVTLLKEYVRTMIVSPVDNNFLFKLNIINSVQHLGVSYHFEHEIDETLHQIYEISTKENNIISYNDDLHHLALLFRLLRQQGYPISSDVFCKFKDQAGKFKESIVNDVDGMLRLYEASQLRFHGEEILEEAYSFTLIELTKSLTTKLSPFLSGLVHHSIGQELRKGMPRLEARYYISFYQQDPSHNECLLTFAKLDFNMLQKLHRKEVSSMTKWWVKDLNVSTNFPFVRDRIVEVCFWIVGVYYEPQYCLARSILNKVVAMTSIIDDVYDAYGTIDELEIFTNAIERWDISSLVDLPEYMKLCYKALLDIFEETEQELRMQGKEYFVKYSKNEMKRLIQAYLTESRWFNSNHTPTVEEYMEVATVTSTYAMLTTVSFLGMEDTTEEVLIWATSHPKIIEAASVIARIMDDIVGSEFEHERGHVVSSVDCYMMQYNSSRENAIKELHKLVESAWKDINEECLNPTQIPMKFLMRVLNLARMMDVLYKEHDNYTNSEGVMKDYINAVLVNKVPTQIS
ncbi:(-)-germacrene D synthase-like [Vigna radiata var. radiata]|uniref:(-)-germacrene D synthase-like n=1 Tax=Vigna radiata var. radiata TaxID=3916 RepID=A0A1S3TI52_VIGRR|nr:(-)-germacrene D synthase-like [Vigna radiata var. radiata]